MTRDGHDDLVQRQFGANAEQYRTSASHARGQSLARLLALARPEAGWRVLDVATGAGHTAAALAPLVDFVVAGDMTREMLGQALAVARDQKRGNICLVRERAGALSYAADSFDLVVCRVAAHHFPEPGAFVGEGARVLKARGLLAVIDNVVPEDAASADWINDFERQRDPSHALCLSLTQWRDMYARHGLAIEHEEVNPKWFDYGDWMRRMSVPEDAIARLGRALHDAPRSVREFWQPETTREGIRFALREAILIGRKDG